MEELAGTTGSAAALFSDCVFFYDYVPGLYTSAKLVISPWQLLVIIIALQVNIIDNKSLKV
jgi:hypothetical protein